MTDGYERFVGRAGELADLTALLRGRGGVALVAGEAGVGKSRLVAEALSRSRASAVWGSCWSGDGAPAFWPWAQVIRACLALDAGAAWADEQGTSAAEVMALVPGDGRPTLAADASRFRLFEGVTRLVDAVAAADDLVIVLDDLQWADEASLRLFGFAARGLHDRPVAFLGTYRDDEVGPGHPLSVVLAELAGRVRHVGLRGLDRDDLSELANDQLGDDEPLASQFVPELQRLTGGNPFFVRELLALARGGRRLETELRVPAGVRAVIERRLARLSNPCHDALTLAAVIGSTFALADLAEAMRQPVADVFALLGEAIEAGIVVTDDRQPGGLRFAHDLLRETIYDALPPVPRASAHARIADAIEARRETTSPATLAHHLISAVPSVARDRAVAAAMRAGDAALAVLANEEAADWFERALSLVRADTGAPTALIAPLLALGEARLRAGHLPAARDAYVEAASVARRHGRADDLAEAALGLGAGMGGFEVALFDHVQIELLEEALRAVGPADSPRRVHVLARLSVALSFVAEERRLDLSTEAVATARRLGDRSALGYALAAHCDAVSGPAHSEAREQFAAEVVALGLDLRDRRLELLGRRLLIVALLELGRIDDADAQIRAFAAAANAIREPLYRWYVPLWRGMRALMAGRLDESAAWCDDAEAIGAEAHSMNAAMLTIAQRWVRLRVDGRLTEAAALLDEKAEVFGDLAGAAVVRVLGRLHAGDVDLARAELQRLVADLERIPTDAEWLSTIAQLAELAASVGNRDSAATLDAAMAPYDHRVVVEGIGAAIYGTLGAYRAPLVRLLGREEDAREIAAAAADAAARMRLVGAPISAARARTGDGPTAERPDERAAIATRETGLWTLSYAGATAHVRDCKGLRDLAVLLANPGAAIHVSELVSQDPAGRAAVSSRGEDVLDRRAIAEFRRRLAELDDELDTANADNDTGLAAKLAAEREFLLAELAGAAGLRGRTRRIGDDVDRARKAVRARVRDAVKRVESAHPELGRHLAHAVRTGTFCSYDPETPVHWTVDL